VGWEGEIVYEGVAALKVPGQSDYIPFIEAERGRERYLERPPKLGGRGGFEWRRWEKAVRRPKRSQAERTCLLKVLLPGQRKEEASSNDFKQWDCRMKGDAARDFFCVVTITGPTTNRWLVGGRCSRFR